MSAGKYITLLLLACLYTMHVSAAPRVVASIAPVHSLVASVMRGVAEPELLVPAGASPHAFALAPSDMRTLYDADLIVWVGRPLERFLIRPLNAIGNPSAQVAVAALPGMGLLKLKDSGEERDGGFMESRTTRGADPHLWLDPRNARLIVTHVARRLAALDPGNARHYATNAKATIARIDDLDARIERRLASVKHLPFVVFHDAYQYFERRYGLSAVAVIQSDPEISPGARWILEVRAAIETEHVRCVFGEPQFNSALVETVLEDTGARRGTLDPEGADIIPGPDAYFILMRRLADSLLGCLAKT
ncbi:MAG: zinc ABC transporter substrate-binding protein [Gammaproteobacteria bacterium]|nr:zinc ABC transporter substrate-binding protein [Gammaproteobacteria bacterium]